MTAAFAIRTLIEFAVVLLVIYGLFHEKKLIRLENRIVTIIARRVRVARAKKRRAASVRHSAPVAVPVTPHSPRHGGDPRRAA